jgi:23S rRNA (uracil1939-C5)-methyltransferase
MIKHSLNKNDIIELEIEDFTSEGSGVGHVNGQTVFVAGTAPGDTVKCIIIKTKPNYAIGKMTEIIKASPDRQIPDCRVFPRCGGCAFRHITYDSELKMKQKRVSDAMHRIGHIDLEVQNIVPSPDDRHYRNKAQYPLASEGGRLLTGFYAPFSHRVIECKTCLLQPQSFAAILRTVARLAEKYKVSVYDERTGKGLLRHIYIRKAFATDETMVCLVENGEKMFKTDVLVNELIKADPSIKTVLININPANTNVILGGKNKILYGDGYITDELLGKKFRISPLSFYQVNRAQAEKLYTKAHEYASRGKTDVVLDLYCGAGTIGLTFADKVKKLIGVEIVPDAVKDAKVNADLNGITNAEFICSDASDAAKKLACENIKPDVIFLDPPRKGCDASLLNTVALMNPDRIVYISCDPATLARDCAVLENSGYKLIEYTPFDMFPRTAHVETVVLLSHQRPQDKIRVELDLTEMDITSSETEATYQEIKDYIFEKHGVKVSSLYIAQIKEKHGLRERENYNKPKSENPKQPQCPAEKEKLIEEALKHFQMI